MIKTMLIKLAPVIDIVTAPFTIFAAILLKCIRMLGVNRLPLSKAVLNKVGMFPIRDHYYEPLFKTHLLKKPLDQDRNLPGINLNTDGQLSLLRSFNYTDELSDVPSVKKDILEFHFNNESFEAGDGEYWYNIIRHFKPAKIIEIGSGNSTLMANRAIKKNAALDSAYKCDHMCIEPYEHTWLEELNIKIVREKIEDLDKNIFQELNENDILFIDSSHIIRPQGDVLCEYLEILPILNKGVIVHIHDIFTPKDYLENWIKGEVKFWNEQYLLEAFLTHNDSWEIMGALNYLSKNYYEVLKKQCYHLTPVHVPGSFYMRKVK